MASETETEVLARFKNDGFLDFEDAEVGEEYNSGWKDAVNSTTRGLSFSIAVLKKVVSGWCQTRYIT